VSTAQKRFRWFLVPIVALGFALVALALAYVFIPRVHWRTKVVWLKASGTLQDISWGELWQLSRHGDPFNVRELAKTPNPYMVIKNPLTSTADLTAGEAIFQAHCAVCHGAGGAGGATGPALKHRQMVKGSSDWAIFKTISLGISGTAMPPSSLPATDRWRLEAYVKSLAEPTGSTPDTAHNSRMDSLKPVRYEDIVDATSRPDQWLTYSGSYDGQRFSSSDQITASNVSRLHLLWMKQYSTQDHPIESTPLVFGGFMFLTLPPNQVVALDARTGETVWQYNRELPPHITLCCGYVNRGLAVLGSTLFLGTLDAHLVALDMRTGKVSWDEQIADFQESYSITGAPLALKNIVVTGVAGGEYGVRGFIDARDAATGKEVWRFDSIPQPGQPGAETWEPGAMKTGGGPTWLTGTFDPESNLIYWPVGNPSPNYNGTSRKGDDLYTDSVVALDADHGDLRWHFQFTPHDTFDWDATEILVSFDKIVSGKRERLLAQADRNAFYYVLDRDNGGFRTAQPLVKQTWASGIDAHGRPIMNPAAVPTPEGATVFPSVGGATNWMSPSYSPITGLMYVPVREWGGVFYTRPAEYRRGEIFTGGYSQIFDNPPPIGIVRAIDASTGEVRWEYRKNTTSDVGGLLSTKGGVVFGSASEFFFALDAKTGQELWRINTGGMITAAPVTYTIDGKQVVAIVAGHDLLVFGL
jgi:alcohol dehydrogenase (cytochrome c)